MKDIISYPCYYDVGDIPVILTKVKKMVIGRCANGRPFPIGKAFVEGVPITKKEYLEMAKALYTGDIINE